MSFQIALISDSTGETADSVLKAVLAQFEDLDASIKRYSNITTPEQVNALVTSIASEKPLIVATLVKEDSRDELNKTAAHYGLEVVYLLTPLMQTIARISGKDPLQQPGTLRRMDDAYRKRVKAIEFAIKCDDGKSPELLKDADLVIFGVSRAGKTPLSMVLANKGFSVANVPLSPNIPPDERIWRTRPDGRIGLLISPEHLMEIRKERLLQMGLDPECSSYANLEKIKEDLYEAECLMKNLGCKVYDSTTNSLEHLAQEIMKDFKLN